MSFGFEGLRAQIQANARTMICPQGSQNSAAGPNFLSSHESAATLIHSGARQGGGDLEVVIFGDGSSFTAAVMFNGTTPAIEGDSAGTPEGALRKLLLATCELLNTYMPKLAGHQRNIHGGGVFDELLISPDLETKKTPS